MNQISNKNFQKLLLEREKFENKCKTIAKKIGMLDYSFEKDSENLFANLIEIFMNYDEDAYFKSNECKYIFALVKLDKEPRAEILGITLSMYEDSKKAKEWYKSIAKIIHPDKSKHPDAEEAMSKLNELYKGMKQDGE